MGKPEGQKPLGRLRERESKSSILEARDLIFFCPFPLDCSSGAMPGGGRLSMRQYQRNNRQMVVNCIKIRSWL
jgi:hypothetical protein